MASLQSLSYKAKRLLRNALLDLRYGGLLGGVRKSPFAHLGIEDTANTDYAALPLIFTDRIHDSDVLVDIGCGKGRVINWWLNRGYTNPIFGIEMDPAVADATRRRLSRFPNVKIIEGDALSNLPRSGTIFYLFNPFGRPWVERLRDQLSAVFMPGDGRSIVYYNCRHVDVFEQDGSWNVEHIRLDNSGRFHPLAWITRSDSKRARL